MNHREEPRLKDLAVLVAVYNDQEALVKALDSIREPDNSFTVVIVDGGSDRRPDIDESRYPFRIVLIEQETNEGLASGLNVGIDYIRAQGFRYLARLDAGDEQRENRFSLQHERFQESEDLVLLGSNAVFVDEDTGQDLFVTNLPRSWEAIKRWNVFRTCFIHPTVMIRLERLDPALRYDLDYPHIEDYVLFRRISERYPSEVLEAPLLDCYVRKSGISCRSERAQLISGIRHHLKHPHPWNPLWYAYLAKRVAFLVIPPACRQLPKRCLNLIKKPSRTHRPRSRAVLSHASK